MSTGSPAYPPLPLYSPHTMPHDAAAKPVPGTDTTSTKRTPCGDFSLTDLTVEIPGARVPLGDAPPRPPARWGTREFKIYYLVVAVAIPIMVWIPVSLSSASHPNYPLYQDRLRDGWLFGRRLDNTDAQYRSFRNNLPLLVPAALVYILIKAVRRRLSPLFPPSSPPSQTALPLARTTLLFALVMIVALHGASALKILFILCVNFAIAKVAGGTRGAPPLIWAFNGAMLFANEVYKGYWFGDMLPALGFLDAYRGINPRWDIWFNITMLRLVSFGMDYHWACRNQPSEAPPSTILTPKQRQALPHPIETYSLINYLTYALYPPLYIGGPIMTFNDFAWQLARPLSLRPRPVAMYALRLTFTLLVMEFILHTMYIGAIKERKAWMGVGPAGVSMLGFWGLIIVWLKLLIPWRFFRLWALLDGIDPPENMVRCMANNYSTLGFWRSWHRSYNLWLIRYIYIPLGGTRNIVLNTVLVFSFVALWHDLTFRLLAWGWLVSLFVVPELLARWLLPQSKHSTKPWYRHICAIGAVLNILMMMGANLVGFVVGTDGIKYFVAQLFGTAEGVRFLVVAACCLFVGAQLMFEYREEEMRKSIYRRC